MQAHNYPKTPHSTQRRLQWRTVEIADASGPLIYCLVVMNHVVIQRERLFPVCGEKCSLIMCSSDGVEGRQSTPQEKKF